ncbi:MAG: hypothetical protein GX894_04295 [Clostridia bacterium]|nr:hypothetical protein [Clostridia bacterium]
MIRIRIHPLFLLTLFISGITGRYLSMLLVFFSVLLHEVAHILTAFGFGYRTTAVELFPFGGVARLDYSLFNDPRAEAVTALAGPVQSGILALLAKAMEGWFGYVPVCGELLRINLGLAFFNLLPLFPLDGGRVLRAFLATARGYTVATRQAVRLTKYVVALGIPASFFLAPGTPVPFYLPFLLVFLYLAAGKENLFYAYWRQKDRKLRVLKEKGLLPARVWLIDAKRRSGEVLPFLQGKDYHLLLLRDRKGRIFGFFKEEELSGLSGENLSLSFYRLWLERKGEKGGKGGKGDPFFLSKKVDNP